MEYRKETRLGDDRRVVECDRTKVERFVTFFLFVVLGAVFSLASVFVVTVLYEMAFGDDEELVPEISDVPVLLLLVLIPLSFALAWAAVT